MSNIVKDLGPNRRARRADDARAGRVKQGGETPEHKIARIRKRRAWIEAKKARRQARLKATISLPTRKQKIEAAARARRLDAKKRRNAKHAAKLAAVA